MDAISLKEHTVSIFNPDDGSSVSLRNIYLSTELSAVAIQKSTTIYRRCEDISSCKRCIYSVHKMVEENEDVKIFFNPFQGTPVRSIIRAPNGHN